jgi:hypothetical protein
MRRLTEHPLPEAVADDTAPISDRAPKVGLRGNRAHQYTLAEKLASRLTVGGPDECWPCSGCSGNRAGHTHLSAGSPTKPNYFRIYAHVFAWEQANGRQKPEGMVIMHSCDEPKCCNPRHLSLGTQADNIHDSIHKGRYNAFGKQKLNAAQVLEIRALSAAGELQRVIAARFGIRRHSVSTIVTGKSWQHLTDRPFSPLAEAPQQLPNLVLEPVRSIQLVIRGEVG